MKILLEQCETEIIVKKSRFISIAIPCTSLEAIKSFIKDIRNLHPEATHVVHSAVVGLKGNLYSFSDDREPKNTAGRPSLEVLKGSGITNILVCTIRYYGGTLLGTGGLVKAYGDSIKEVLKFVKIEEYIQRCDFLISISYDFFDLVKRLLNELEAVDINEDFSSFIKIKGKIALENIETLKKRFNEITNARGTLII